MDKIKLKKTSMVARQILLYFVDLNREILPVFDKRNIYRLPFKAYDKFRLQDKTKFSREMYRLKQQGLIKVYLDGKEKNIELTKRGKEKLKKQLVGSLEIHEPLIWDGKWRLVIFDIPDGKKGIRQYLRNKLLSIGFIELQESVYVFPFECLDEINLIRENFFIKPYVQFILADRIETEKNLIETFLDLGILKESQIKKENL